MSIKSKVINNDKSIAFYKSENKKLSERCAFLESENAYLKSINDALQDSFNSMISEYENNSAEIRKNIADLGRLRLKYNMQIESSKASISETLKTLENEINRLTNR